MPDPTQTEQWENEKDDALNGNLGAVEEDESPPAQEEESGDASVFPSDDN